MMGSHAQYANRYPPEFNHFTDSQVKGFETGLSSGKVDTINQYDNSVLYTDSIVQQTLNLLKQGGANIKALTLFSDHGEEVYDKINIKGHSPDNVTANMVEVPLITWTSDGFAQLKAPTLSAMQNNHQQGFRLDSLYHYATDLMGISAEQVDKQKSLASEQFTPITERIVYKKSYEQKLRYREVSNQPKAISKN
jgi:heptose-I-phosphate ethanolaminephosphotransferase